MAPKHKKSSFLTFCFKYDVNLQHYPHYIIIFELVSWYDADVYVVLAIGEHGWRSGEALAFHLSDPGSIPVLVVSCGFSWLLLLRGFFSGFSGFPPSTKSSSPNSNFIWTRVAGLSVFTVLQAYRALDK